MTRVKDIMTTNVVTIEPNTTVAEALDRLRRAGIRSLIVERQSPDDCYGIVTQRDIAYRVVARGLDPTKMRIREIMTKPLASVNEGMTVTDVARLMSNLGLSRMPVLSDGELQGIVSVSDIVADIVAAA